MHLLKTLTLVAALCLLWSCTTTPPPISVDGPPRFEPTAWSSLEGWKQDSPEQAWSAFLLSCKAIGARAEWRGVCDEARAQPSPSGSAVRTFFESKFTPYSVVIGQAGRTLDSGLITGYYEPLLHGARKPSPQFSVPLYSAPDDLLTIDLGDLYPELKGKRVRGRVQGKKVVPYPSRAELNGYAGLKGKELVWVSDAVEAFFLEVQGSGRVQLNDGETIRLAYGDQNGHPYRSIGRYLIDLGELTLENASAQGIRQWVQQHPERLREVLNANPSAVFFRAEKISDPKQGPNGALAVPLTPERSVAIDPAFIMLGAPVFLSTTYPNSETPLHRLVMAQDTGGAIRGPIRADLFWGFGASAGEQAGRMRQQGKLWLLWPKGSVPSIAK